MIWNWILSWAGLNPHLPRSRDINNPQHGQEARNWRGQKVIYDVKQGGKWVLPQNFSDKQHVTITKG